jgi:starch phosphorylase
MTDTTAALRRLARDLSWSWNHSADEIWRELDPELWDLTANPWLIVQSLSPKRLASLGAPLRERIERLAQELDERNAAPAWFQTAHAGAPLRGVAYFSMEYMLSEALPIYSGGLGNVAGDQLKAASDLGVPVTAVGLLYQQGYFRQELDANGEQRALYPANEPGQLPIEPLLGKDGEPLRLALALPGGKIWIRTWQVRVGRARLLLLDSNDPANPPGIRAITSELYGGGPRLRLEQELLLGIVGWRLLRALSIPIDVCHLNEGHAAFAVLERARTYMEESRCRFHEALAVTRAGNLFTTHTAVEAGFDRFAPELIRTYMALYAQDDLGISTTELLALGRKDPRADAEPFNMAYLAIRGSGSVNAVSTLHAKVSRRLFAPLFPRLPEAEVPVGHVTNGVHMPTWDGAEADRLWTDLCGKGPWRGDPDALPAKVRAADDSRIWAMKNAGRAALVAYARGRLGRQAAGHGASLLQVQQAEAALNPHTLTLGFARRFATYKRPDLLLHDKDRLARILTNARRPVQLVLAGKAHPQDEPGKALIREWTEFLRAPEIRPHVVFLADYDMLLAQRLVEGVDVWMNTPRRPWEASGTSGMKVLVNGALNLSVLDGWWAEAYTPEVGWAIGDGEEHGDDPEFDRRDAEALYDVLENQVIPEFYERDESGVPRRWVARIRESMATLTPRFSAGRTVRQYTEQEYLPAAAAYAKRVSGGAKEFLAWQEEIARAFGDVRFGALRAAPQDGGLAFEAELFLGGVHEDAVAVELSAEPLDGGPPVHERMRARAASNGGPLTFTAFVETRRPASDFTPRVLPRHALALPTEVRRVVWK